MKLEIYMLTENNSIFKKFRSFKQEKSTADINRL